MRKQRGFALVQVMLFSMLVVAFIYSMIIVQNARSKSSSVQEQAATIAPAVYSIVNYTIQEETSGTSNNTVTGQAYYASNDPLSQDYQTELTNAGYDFQGVTVTQS